MVGFVTNQPVEVSWLWKWMSGVSRSFVSGSAYAGGMLHSMWSRLSRRGPAKSKAELRRDERRRRKELVKAAQSPRRRAA